MTESETTSHAGPVLSIIVPALNEEDNVGPLTEEVRKAVIDAGIDAELIVIDDGSTDATPARLRELGGRYRWLRVLRREKPLGQSAAMYAGIQHARGQYVAMLDADLQNDPADLPALLAAVQRGECDMAQGSRTKRKDTIVRKGTSWVGRTTRRLLLNDHVRDTGCTTRVVKVEIARQFPLMFKGMHRFMPAYANMLGARVIEVPVNHRSRHSGVAKYGILNRGLVGLFDTFSVRWMTKRYRNPTVTEVTPGATGGGPRP